MKKLSAIPAMAVLGAVAFAIGPEAALERTAWYGQNSLRFELAGKIVYIDPVGVKSDEKADAILITHDHGDHYSAGDVARLSKDGTIVYAAFAAPNAKKIAPGQKVKVGDVEIEAVPAYNVKKTQFHPKSKGYCGFLIRAEGVAVYVAGDTERIPEMKKIVCDLAFLPLGQTYTMGSVDEAVEAAVDVRAKIAVPVHFGAYEGTAEDAARFVAEVKKRGAAAAVLAKR